MTLTIDWLNSARALIDTADPNPENVALAQAHALVSIAESLATLVGDQARDLREERLRTESLKGALKMARLEEDGYAEDDRVAESVGALIGYAIVQDAPFTTLAEAADRLKYHGAGARIAEVRELPEAGR